MKKQAEQARKTGLWAPLFLPENVLHLGLHCHVGTWAPKPKDSSAYLSAMCEDQLRSSK